MSGFLRFFVFNGCRFLLINVFITFSRFFTIFSVLSCFCLNFKTKPKKSIGNPKRAIRFLPKAKCLDEKFLNLREILFIHFTVFRFDRILSFLRRYTFANSFERKMCCCYSHQTTKKPFYRSVYFLID